MCTDQVVGDILSSWRYDISGIAPEMRTDYEEHLRTCVYCQKRQRLHRMIDKVVLWSGYASALLVAPLVVANTIEVFMRYALNSPT